MFLEVIAKSIADVKSINKSAADRIELCVEMDKDGLTPPIAMIKEAVQTTRKRLMIMLRIKANGFELNEQELSELLHIIAQTKDLDFEGYVFGATSNNQVDTSALAQISKTIGNTKTITFHKAFDTVRNQKEALQAIARFPNVKHILTSGGFDNDPVRNLAKIKRLASFQASPKILIGGGVNTKNFTTLLQAGLSNIHIGKAARKTPSYAAPISITTINYMKRF